MAAAATDLFKKGVAQWTGNIGSAGVADAVVTTVPLSSPSGLPTDTAVVATINRVDANQKRTSNSEGIIGVVSGNNLINCVRGVEGTAQAWTGGIVVEILFTAKNWNDLIDGILVQHNQDGTHKDALVTSLKATGESVNTGEADNEIVTPKALADSDYLKSSDLSKATAAENVAGTDDAKYLTALANVPAFNDSLYRQALINGNFVVNQRVYVSDATLAAGVYGHDRWKAGASGGDYTFTQLPSSTTITIKTGKSLIQVIEDKNVVGGTYTLSWTGTAQARFGINSATPSGAYAASPITITTQTAGTVMSVEFNEGTLGKVQLNSGDVALPFMPKSYEEELRACMRYYKRVFCAANGAIATREVYYHTNDMNFFIPDSNVFRVKGTPTLLGTANTAGGYCISDVFGGGTQTGFTFTPLGHSNGNGFYIACSKNAHGKTSGAFSFGSSGGYEINAEL